MNRLMMYMALTLDDELEELVEGLTEKQIQEVVDNLPNGRFTGESILAIFKKGLKAYRKKHNIK